MLRSLSGYMLSPLQQDQGHLLYRGVQRDSKRPVLVLAPASKVQTRWSLARMEHQYGLKAHLPSAWCTKPVALLRDGPLGALVMEDPGGEPLNQAAEPGADLSRLLRIAIGCSHALGHVHARGLVHNDIRPANLLVNTEGKVSITGFGMAFQPQRGLHGGIASPDPGRVFEYLAPEQTGRLNRSIDFRSDLYSLGVVLYQLLVGALPFSASDAIEWMHAHIARRPVALRERRADMPEPLEAIVLKLLAKLPEERYQTAVGLEADLKSCLQAWEANARVDMFVLGRYDFPGQLQSARRMYGREAELLSLATALSKVQASEACGIAFLAGAAGAGKSSLVDELRKSPTARDISFVMGKFEQHAGEIPYAALAQALLQLVRPLLALGDLELGAWRARLHEALGLNGQLMVNLVPELALIIGEQEPVQDAQPQETQSRFHLALGRLLGVFATAQRSLVLFLDDLQWADASTLAVLERLIAERDVPNLLLVCAYRPEEIGPAHPLVRVLESIRQSDGPAEHIVIPPLGPSDVRRLVVDALGIDSAGVQALADLVCEKTGGNPFFVQQFLISLVDEDLLTFDRSASVWQWKQDRIQAKDMTANVADVIALKLDRLSAAAREALKYLACLGMKGTSVQVAGLAGLSSEAIEAALAEASANQVVCCTDEGYRFIHDRVREAAYALIPEDERSAWHLRTGRILAADAAGAIEPQVFAIVSHYNRGASLIDSEAEKQTLASLNLAAGRRARDATAYLEGASFFGAGLTLLAPDRWTRQFGLAFNLELGLAECDFLIGEFVKTRTRLTELLPHAASKADRALVTARLVSACIMSGEVDRALALGLDHLRGLGIHWSACPSDGDVDQELQGMWSQIGERPIESLIDLPLMSDPQWRSTMDLLHHLMVVGGSTNRNLLAIVLARSIRLSIEHGNHDTSCIAFGFATSLVSAGLLDHPAAHRFGQLAVKLVQRPGLSRQRAAVLVGYANTQGIWNQPLRECCELLKMAADIGRETGQHFYRTTACTNLLEIGIAAGDPLGELMSFASEVMSLRGSAGPNVANAVTKFLLIRALREPTPDNALEESTCAVVTSQGQAFESEYWIRKLQQQFFAGDFNAAIESASKAEPGMWICDAYMAGAEFHLFAALSHAAVCNRVGPDQRESHLERVRHEHALIAATAALCPENFGCRAALVGAELARLEGRELDAEKFYEKAIQSAREQSFLHLEALGFELAARFYDSRGFMRIAEAYASDARLCYLAWGADAKAAQLDRDLSHLLHKPTTPLPEPVATATADRLDLETVYKLTEATTSEIALPRLIDVVMRLAIEQAGADRGVLVLVRGDRARVEAEARAADTGVEIRLIDAEHAAAEVPDSILRYVARTGENLLIADASKQHLFSEDPYFRKFPGRSILCLPMLKQATLVGQLYLENRQVSDVFTPARFVVLKLLAAQAAISIENARLYAGLRRAESALVRAQQAERDRIARELHDTLLQSTQGLVLLFQNVAGSFVAGSPIRIELEAALDQAQEVIQEGRDRVAHLRMATDGARDLAGALDAAARGLAVQGGAVCTVEVQGAKRAMDEEVGEQAYRIGREALVNAFKHARASAIQVDLIHGADEFRLRVSDDGVGIDAQTLEAMSLDGHWGLIGMRERAHQMGARLEIQSRPGLGTEIELRVPARIAYGEGMQIVARIARHDSDRAIC